mgnify:CR=1 FL=1
MNKVMKHNYMYIKRIIIDNIGFVKIKTELTLSSTCSSCSLLLSALYSFSNLQKKQAKKISADEIAHEANIWR